MAIGFEYTGAVKVQITPSGGAIPGTLIDLGQTPAEERCVLTGQQLQHEVFTDEGGLVPQEIINLGQIGVLNFTLNKFDQVSWAQLFTNLPRDAAVVVDSFRQGRIGALWATPLGGPGGGGFFGVRIKPLWVAGSAGRIERTMTRCYLSGEWWRDREYGNTEFRRAVVINVLPSSTGELYSQQVVT